MHRARKRFGQHFLTAPDVVDRIVGAILPAADDVLVEIGPGQAALTDSLAASGATLHAIELDRDLAAALAARFGNAAVRLDPALSGHSAGRVTIHEADALDFDFGVLGPRLRFVGNLPYNVSTPLLFRLLGYRDRMIDAHFMLQKEVVDRMSAPPGNRTFGRLSVALQCRLHVESLFDVPPEAFSPPPKVMSSVVRLAPLPADAFPAFDDRILGDLLRQAFSQRRKTLRNALRQIAGDADLAAAGLDPGDRPEQVPVAGWIALARRMDTGA